MNRVYSQVPRHNARSQNLATLYCTAITRCPSPPFRLVKRPRWFVPLAHDASLSSKVSILFFFFTPRRLCCVIGLASSGGDQLNFIYIDRVKLNNISMWPQLRCEKGRRESRATCAAVCGRFVVYFMLNKHVFLFFPYTGTRSSSIVYGGKMDFFFLSCLHHRSVAWPNRAILARQSASSEF